MRPTPCIISHVNRRLSHSIVARRRRQFPPGLRPAVPSIRHRLSPYRIWRGVPRECFPQLLRNLVQRGCLMTFTPAYTGRWVERIRRQSIGGHLYQDGRHACDLRRRRNVRTPRFDAVRPAAPVVVRLHRPHLPCSHLRGIHGLHI